MILFLHQIVVFVLYMNYYCLLTLQKKKVLGQLKNREKCFKICYVYGERKPMQFFSFFIQSNFHFPLMSTQTRAFIRGKFKVALNEKRKKLHGFSFSINIANFEAFLQRIKLTKNLLFLKRVTKRSTLQEKLHLEFSPHTFTDNSVYIRQVF